MPASTSTGERSKSASKLVRLLRDLEDKYAPSLLEGKPRPRDTIGERNLARKRLYCALEDISSSWNAELDGANASPTEEQRRIEVLRKLCKLEKLPSTSLTRALKIIRLCFTLPWMICGGAYVFIIGLACKVLDPIFAKYVFGTGASSAGLLPSDLLQMWYAKSVLYCSGVKVVVEGAEYARAAKSTGSVVMFSHASFLDPFIVSSVTPLSLRYVGKQSVFFLPIFGWAAWILGHIPINRSNRQRAISSLKRVAKYLSAPGRAVAISPEGTRSTNGQIRPFKKGPFYLRSDTSSDVLPVYMGGNYGCGLLGLLSRHPEPLHCASYLQYLTASPRMNWADHGSDSSRGYGRCFSTLPQTQARAAWQQVAPSKGVKHGQPSLQLQLPFVRRFFSTNSPSVPF